jgi:hypothetical protein
MMKSGIRSTAGAKWLNAQKNWVSNEPLVVSGKQLAVGATDHFK